MALNLKRMPLPPDPLGFFAYGLPNGDKKKRGHGNALPIRIDAL